MKYSKNNDNFVHKLNIFHHFCDKSDISYEARFKAFSSMFRGFSFVYYLANVNMLKHVSLNQLCIFICIHFEKSINVKNNFIKWNQITLKSIMIKQKNESKSMIDCLNILVNKLRHLQYGLNFELQNETFMQNHFIIECEKMSACQLTCYKHSLTLADQIIDLHTIINVFEKFHRVDFETKIFFIDRRYHRVKWSRDRVSDRKPDPKTS